MPTKVKMDEVFARLLSTDDRVVLDALTIIQAQGDARAIPPMLHVLAGDPDHKVRQKIEAMLYEIKVPEAVPALIEALGDPGLRSIRRTVIAAFWNAGLDVREHLELLVSCAIEGDAAECLECHTVITDQEVWPEKDARRAMHAVLEAVKTETDSYKASLLRDIADALAHRPGER
ncbi:MAG: HEAT repeat domain-containing protein [Flavobacteriales bacterium]|nr:HEAT repeat domain-containing protein [Flavobacteriales bacterium]MCB9194118.1 HEAT repeat domain-containing protein [Flavobacteriales bacterium]